LLLETRLLFHKRDKTIRGHVFRSFLALLLKKELEDRLLKQNIQWKWIPILREWDNLHEVEAVFQGKRLSAKKPVTRRRPQGYQERWRCRNANVVAVAVKRPQGNRLL